MKHNPRSTLKAALAFIAFALPSWAQAQTLSYNGTYLENARGVTGNRSMEVRLYTTSTNGTIVAKETFPSVKITAGKFNIKYGNNGIADKLAGTNWVAVAVAGVELKPRVQIATVPFALHSGDTQALKSRIAALELKAESDRIVRDELLLAVYNDFLDRNPNWQFGEIWAQVVSQSEYTSLSFGDPGQQIAFDIWYEIIAGISPSRFPEEYEYAIPRHLWK